VSTYGAKPAEVEVPVPVPVVAVSEGVAVGVALAVGVGFEEAPAVGAGVAVSVGRPVGAGVPPVSTEHLAPSMRHAVGSPAVPLAEVTKPTVRDLPAAIPALSQLAAVTLTCWPLTADSAFQRELSLVPDGRSNSRVQSVSAVPVSLVMTYWPV
jgi:hypothetical protein